MEKICNYYHMFILALIAMAGGEVFLLCVVILDPSFLGILAGFVLFLGLPAFMLIGREQVIHMSRINNYLRRCLDAEHPILEALQNCTDEEEATTFHRRFERITVLFTEACHTQKIPIKDPEDC